MSAVERLTAALRECGAPEGMIAKAAAGGYGDFTSESATPIMDLVRDLNAAGLRDVAKRAMEGEFDGR